MLYSSTLRERNNLRAYSFMKQWKPNDQAEILTFLAILVIMVIIHKPRINMWWPKDVLVSTQIYGQLIARDKISFLCLDFYSLLTTIMRVHMIQIEIDSIT